MIWYDGSRKRVNWVYTRGGTRRIMGISLWDEGVSSHVCELCIQLLKRVHGIWRVSFGGCRVYSRTVGGEESRLGGGSQFLILRLFVEWKEIVYSVPLVLRSILNWIVLNEHEDLGRQPKWTECHHFILLQEEITQPKYHPHEHKLHNTQYTIHNTFSYYPRALPKKIYFVPPSWLGDIMVMPTSERRNSIYIIKGRDFGVAVFIPYRQESSSIIFRRYKHGMTFIQRRAGVGVEFNMRRTRWREGWGIEFSGHGWVSVDSVTSGTRCHGFELWVYLYSGMLSGI